MTGLELFAFAIIMMIVSYAITASMTPKPEKPLAGQLDIPTATQGGSVPVCFGENVVKQSKLHERPTHRFNKVPRIKEQLTRRLPLAVKALLHLKELQTFRSLISTQPLLTWPAFKWAVPTVHKAVLLRPVPWPIWAGPLSEIKITSPKFGDDKN